MCEAHPPPSSALLDMPPPNVHALWKPDAFFADMCANTTLMVDRCALRPLSGIHVLRLRGAPAVDGNAPDKIVQDCRGNDWQDVGDNSVTPSPLLPFPSFLARPCDIARRVRVLPCARRLPKGRDLVGGRSTLHPSLSSVCLPLPPSLSFSFAPSLHNGH